MAQSAFTDNQISNWAKQYEREVAARYDLIVDRVSLGVTAFVNEYQLPNYVTNIRSVLWLGKELHAKGFRASVITGDTPFQTAGSVPFEYVFSGKGQRVLKFYPSPNLTVAYNAGDLWTPQADETSIIVEFWRTPDYISQPSKVLPDWLRQYLLKDYVCSRAFNAEGPQQDLRAAAYYEGRLEEGLNYVELIKENMHASQVNVLYDRKMLGRRKPGRPVLPPNFGYPVNW